MTARTLAQRQQDLRDRRESLGLKRREIYAHDEDWPRIQKIADRLKRKRESQRPHIL